MGTPTSRKGLLVIIERLVSTGPNVWAAIAAQRDGEFGISTEGIDATNKDGLLITPANVVNGQLVITRKTAAGTRIRFVKPAPSTSLSVAVDGNGDITVTLATDGSGDVDCTAEDVLDAIEGDSPGADDLVTVAYPDGGDGSAAPGAFGMTTIAEWRILRPGTRTWRIAGEGLYPVTDAARGYLEDAHTNGTQVRVRVAIATASTWDGVGVVTELQPGGTYNDMASYRFAVEGTDELL
jgi:hypothetical protein